MMYFLASFLIFESIVLSYFTQVGPMRSALYRTAVHIPAVTQSFTEIRSLILYSLFQFTCLYSFIILLCLYQLYSADQCVAQKLSKKYRLPLLLQTDNQMHVNSACRLGPTEIREIWSTGQLCSDRWGLKYGISHNIQEIWQPYL